MGATVQGKRPLSVVIVGAGAAGTLLATRILRTVQNAPAIIRLVDPADTTGRGVAYSTSDWRHRLNVPSGKMSAFPEEPQHFTNWLARNGEDANPGSFAPRALYGAYLEDCLEQAAAASTATLERVHEQVVEICPRGSRYEVRCSGAGRYTADWVVLAVGSPRKDRAWAPLSLVESDYFVANPWSSLEDPRLVNANSVLIVGAGLTMVDMAISLGSKRSGQPRQIHSISRTGRLPTAHKTQPSAAIPAPQLPEAPITIDKAHALVNRQIELSIEETGDWRPGVDSIRTITNDLWEGLSIEDRAEFVDSRLRQWEVLRHRMAPQSADCLKALREQGTLQHHAGTIVHVQDLDGFVRVELADGTSIDVDAVLDCTGPAPLAEHSGTGALLLADLFSNGVARNHELALGLDSDSHGRLFNQDGVATETLRVIGAMRRGALWETTAMPEIRVQAAQLAADISRAVARRKANQRPRDLYGLELSAAPDAADAYNDALGRLLRVQSGVELSLQTALDRDGDFALAHLMMALLAHEYDEPVDAQGHLARAKEVVARRGTDRERTLVACMSDRISGLDPAGSGVVAYLGEHPRDSLATSVAVPTIAFAGIYRVPSDAWQLMESLAPHYGSDWWFAGLLGFVRQEQGRYAEAEALCQYSLGIEPEAGTAVHARAHVFFETGQHSAGLEWIDEWISTCGRDAVHRAHFSWHAALHEFAMNDDDAVRRRYHRQLAPPAVTGMRSLVDSASLLWRWRIEDAAVSQQDARSVIRAADRRDVFAPKTAFAAMHAALALAVNEDLSGLESLRVHCWGSSDSTMREVSAPLATALSWFVSGHFNDAADLLVALEPNLHRIGGSDAQREVLLDTAIEAMVKSGRLVEAVTRLQRRLDLRPRPRDERALTNVVRRMSHTAS